MDSGMQQATEENRQGEETSPERPCGLALAEHMRLLADAYAGATRFTLLCGADEIERLRVVIQSYAASAKAAAEEIKVLRSHVYRDRIVVVDGAVE